MKSLLKYISFRMFALFVSVAIVTSCNKDLPLPTPIAPPQGSGTESIGSVLNSDPNYSFFKAAATRVGVLNSLSDSTNVFTLFLPDNDAFILSGIPSTDVIGALPIETVGAIVKYHLIPGQRLTSADVPTTFPNVQEPSAIAIGSLPGTLVPLNLFNFPSKRATGFWLNNIPVIQPDIPYTNGIIHKVAAIVTPPGLLLKAALDTNSSLNYFRAAIARADSGQTGLGKFDSLLNYAVTNMTVLAPNDAAFRTLIFGLAFQGYLAADTTLPHTAMDTAIAIATGNGAVAAGPVFLSTNNVSTATIRGIIAYHFLATANSSTGNFEPNIRVFSVNFSPTPSFVTTLVNGGVPTHPGILANATFMGPFVTNLTFKGLGPITGGVPYSGTPANAVVLDKHAVNGVYYVIDKVLLPQ